VQTTVFETPRLRARRLEGADVEALFSVYGNAEVVRWVDDGSPLSRERCEQWVEVTQNNYRTRGYGMFALERKPGRQLVGFCGLVHPAGQVEPEIKYAFHQAVWGQGLATEAARGLLTHGATEHHLNRIIATAAPENSAAHRVLVKAGMALGPIRTNPDGSRTQVFVWQRECADALNTRSS
jgi:RimJ/RimL family protein N-acetyltransferase